MPKQPTIHILLAAHNGERYLEQQLVSIAKQTYTSWTLTVSDDCSSDNTLLIVEQFAEQVHQHVAVLTGPNEGSSTANFCHLIAQAGDDNPEDLYAFCDQDDVWHEDKLLRAAIWHARHQDHAIRLYCGRTQFVNKALYPIGLSPNINYPPSFGNALVQNIASGNTMVFSHAVLMAQKRISPHHSVWHDWTTYIVATALGGLIRFDVEPCLYYRQHDGNVIGSNDSLLAQLKRLKFVFSGRFKNWNDANIAATHELNVLTLPTTKETCNVFENLRSSKYPWQTLIQFIKSDIRRQTLASNISLLFALLIKAA
jgi:glycosyltransferase involved in cell wall biosynthesis